jgi:hypothetical protein
MAMPTRLPVLLHRLKSACAGAWTSATASAARQNRTDVKAGKGKSLNLLGAGIA